MHIFLFHPSRPIIPFSFDILTCWQWQRTYGHTLSQFELLNFVFSKFDLAHASAPKKKRDEIIILIMLMLFIWMLLHTFIIIILCRILCHLINTNFISFITFYLLKFLSLLIVSLLLFLLLRCKLCLFT